MPEALPSRVDAFRLAGRGARIENTTPVAMMSRLVSLLADDAGTARSELAFVRDASDWCVVDGHAAAEVHVTCQRCLETMPVRLDVRLRLGVAADESEAERLPDGLEGVLSEDGQLSPLALVEDELILALPIVALHADCSAPVGAVPAPASDDSNPFAVLKALKNKQ